jgi:hypothetical protein
VAPDCLARRPCCGCVLSGRRRRPCVDGELHQPDRQSVRLIYLTGDWLHRTVHAERGTAADSANWNEQFALAPCPEVWVAMAWRCTRARGSPGPPPRGPSRLRACTVDRAGVSRESLPGSRRPCPDPGSRPRPRQWSSGPAAGPLAPRSGPIGAAEALPRVRARLARRWSYRPPGLAVGAVISLVAAALLARHHTTPLWLRTRHHAGDPASAGGSRLRWWSGRWHRPPGPCPRTPRT